MDNDTDTDFLADFHADPRTEVVVSGSRPTAARVAAAARVRADCRSARNPFSSPTCRADFCATRAFPRVGDARVYTCTCTVHDKLSCTRLENYTI